MQNSSYAFAQVWNEALLTRAERTYGPRKRIWASELGKARVDVFLAMKGEPPSNPPNPRSLRKFEAGNIWEWIISLILHRAGILEECQRYVTFTYPGLLQVTGKADFICSGKPALEFAEKEIETLSLPEVFLRSGRAITKHLIEKRAVDSSDSRPLEIKSCSAYMFEARERKQTASRHHKLQLYHYLRGLDLPMGEIVYICRDDCRMMEFVVQNHDPQLEEEYRGEILALTVAMANDERPPLESKIVWDAEIGKFTANWKVAYSIYLKKLYGHQDQADFDGIHKPIVARWNRVIGRMARKEKRTPNNEAAIKEMIAAGYNPDQLVIDFGGGEEEEAGQ